MGAFRNRQPVSGDVVGTPQGNRGQESTISDAGTHSKRALGGTNHVAACTATVFSFTFTGYDERLSPNL